MPRLAANITTMYQELPVAERCDAAARHGFQAVEFLSPYDFSPQEIIHWLETAGLKLLLININPGENGEAGTAALPGREAFFKQSFKQALDYASSLHAPMIHVLAGRETAEQPLSRTLFIEQIREAADLADRQGITLNLEPLNSKDVPGYLHSQSVATTDLLQAIGRDNVKMQFDFYHLQIMEGNLAASLSRYLPLISHVQFSSVPGRHEPQYGEVNVAHLLDYLDEIGYGGWVGCEYWPKAGTEAGLGWAAEYGIYPETQSR